MFFTMSQSLSNLPVHLIFSTKDRCPLLGKSDLLQPTQAYLPRFQRCATLGNLSYASQAQPRLKSVNRFAAKSDRILG